MSFQEERSAISICNKALSRIYQQPLAGSLDDPANRNKPAGRECARWYKTVVRSLLEKHHFGLATKRVALTTTTSNRGEWPFAYNAPSDMAFPVGFDVYGTEGSQISYYRGIGYLLATLYGKPVFRYENGLIYSHIEGASLDYVSFNITEADFNQTFENLVIGYLAAELALPIAKDEDMAARRRNEADRAFNAAIAQSLNATNPRYGDGPSETELARAGGYEGVDHLLGLYR